MFFLCFTLTNYKAFKRFMKLLYVQSIESTDTWCGRERAIIFWEYDLKNALFCRFYSNYVSSYFSCSNTICMHLLHSWFIKVAMTTMIYLVLHYRPWCLFVYTILSYSVRHQYIRLCMKTIILSILLQHCPISFLSLIFIVKMSQIQWHETRYQEDA